MYNNSKIVAIIPARGGSKRLPKKNIIPLGGKPLISWTIEAAIKSKYIDTVVVSSDCDEILDIAKKYKGIVTLKRPDEISTDDSKSIDVVTQVLNYFEKDKNIVFDYSIFLQPTSPFRDEKDIDGAIEYLFEKNANAIIGVTKLDHNLQWSNFLPKSTSMKNFLTEKSINARSQDLEDYYKINGSIYLNKISELQREFRFILSDKIYGYKMDRLKSIDIDTKLDFMLAQTIIKEKDE